MSGPPSPPRGRGAVGVGCRTGLYGIFLDFPGAPCQIAMVGDKSAFGISLWWGICPGLNWRSVHPQPGRFRNKKMFGVILWVPNWHPESGSPAPSSCTGVSKGSPETPALVLGNARLGQAHRNYRFPPTGSKTLPFSMQILSPFIH